MLHAPISRAPVSSTRRQQAGPESPWLHPPFAGTGPRLRRTVPTVASPGSAHDGRQHQEVGASCQSIQGHERAGGARNDRVTTGFATLRRPQESRAPRRPRCSHPDHVQGARQLVIDRAPQRPVIIVATELPAIAVCESTLSQSWLHPRLRLFQPPAPSVRVTIENGRSELGQGTSETSTSGR